MIIEFQNHGSITGSAGKWGKQKRKNAIQNSCQGMVDLTTKMVTVNIPPRLQDYYDGKYYTMNRNKRNDSSNWDL